MIIKKLHLFIFITALLFAINSFSEELTDIKPVATKFRLSFEELSLPEKDKMGFAGGTFLYDVNDWLSLGPAAYGAITGDLGGFITIGMALNAQKQIIEKILLDGGFFLGAGGGKGGYTLAGGGLMLRSHAGLYYASNKWGHIGAGASYIDFPNGSIHSLQPYIAYEYPFEMYTSPTWIKEYLSGSLQPALQEVALIYKNYFIDPNTQDTPQNMGIFGMQWYRYFLNKLFLTIESEGAISGDSSGYMQILLGGGLRQDVLTNTFIKLIGEVGVAGGGGIDTGGGLLLDGGVSLQHYLTKSIYLSLNGDYAGAPNGKFKAYSAGLQLGYGFLMPDAVSEDDKFTNSDPYAPNTLRVRATNQTYLRAAKNWRRHHEDETVNNLGVQLDYFASNNFYLTGQGIAAYSGNAGAYMAGMVGPGLYLPIAKSPIFFDIEGLVAAAGGGGLDIVGGLALQGNAGLGINLTKGLSLMAYYGYLGAVQGAFKANVVGATLAYNFTLFSKPKLF